MFLAKSLRTFSKRKNDFMEYYSQSSPRDELRAAKPFLIGIAVLFGLTCLSYVQLKEKKSDLSVLEPKDYEHLTARQIKKREEYEQRLRGFNIVLNRLQEKLKEDYQEQLEEFQEYMASIDSQDN